MKKILILFFLFCGLNGMTQNDYAYFAKSGLLVDNAKDADIKIERHEISSKKFELIEFRKFGDHWTQGASKNIISVKKNNQYSVETIFQGQLGMKNMLEVVDTTDTGFIIKEYSNGFCNAEAEVLSVFPKVYHGVCKYFSRNKDENPKISYFYKNLEFRTVNQPDLDEVEVPVNNVEQLPEYPGGMAQFLSDLSRKTVFSVDVTADDLKEVLLLSFTIDASGRLLNPHFLKKGKPQVDQVLLRACSQAGKPWRPAVLNQKNSDFTYLVPLDFSIEVKKVQDPNKVLMTADKMPKYPGGEEKLRRDIALKLMYPAIAQSNGIQGKVYVNFFVDTEGEMRNIHVVRGVDPSLDAEALRVVKTLGRWIPGELAGKKVCVSYTVPINFVL